MTMMISPEPDTLWYKIIANKYESHPSKWALGGVEVKGTNRIL